MTLCSLQAIVKHSTRLPIEWLQDSLSLADHGWLCTAQVVWSVLLRAAARCISIFAACRDLSEGPCPQAMLNALHAGLPKTLPVLERRLNEALVRHLPRWMRRRGWQVAVDWHLMPYYGQPQASRNELYYGKPKQGTSKFHAYATACIVARGERFTLAVAWVRRHETKVAVLRKLIARIRNLGLKIKCLLCDREFFNVPVVECLQTEQLPFLMPVMFRGRPPKKKTRKRGLHRIKQQPAGWYPHTMKNKQRAVTVQVCVAYRTHRNRKDKRRVQQKLLFAAWRFRRSPTETREFYRKRFGIETSYRQLRQARIYTCTRDPHLRFLFVVVALVLQNLWLWIHITRLREHGGGDEPNLRLFLLRFRRALDWIANRVATQLHDGTMPCVNYEP